jgi:hypothetical protein
MARKNYVSAGTKRTLEKLDKVNAKLAAEIRKNLDAGMDEKKAIDTAVKDLGYADKLKVIYSTGIDNMLAEASGEKPEGIAFRKWYLNKAFDEDGLSLSERVNNISKMKDIKATIRKSLKEGSSWRKVAQDLTDKDLNKADIPKYMDNLVNKARRALTGNPAAFKEYKQAVWDAKVNIDKLARNGAPTQRLKAAYQELLRVTEKTSTTDLNKSIERMVAAKQRYNAERIARTEMAKAYAQQNYAAAIDDNDVVAIGYELNDEHPRPDICDFHTGVNMFGLGAGVYPLSDLPKYPFHPHCICMMYNVYEGDAKDKMDKGAVKKFLSKLPANKQKAIMGAAGSEAFARNPDKWDKVVNGYQGQYDVKELYTAKQIKS